MDVSFASYDLIGCLWERKSEKGLPNIIVFVADDAGMDFGCYGNNGIKTPNIDRLAKEGIRFEKAYLTSPQSSPSRTSMMTGQFAHTIGTEDLHNPLDGSTKMIPYYFNQAGYSTGVMLKTHWGSNGDKQFTHVIKGGYKPNQGDLTEELYRNYRKFWMTAKSNPFSYGLALLILTGLIIERFVLKSISQRM